VRQKAIAKALSTARKYVKKAGGGEIMSDTDDDAFLPGRDYAVNLSRILRAARSAPKSFGAEAIREAVKAAKEAEGIQLYHGGRDWNAERLVRLPDGHIDYIVGKPGELPDIPRGASLIADYPHGRPRLSEFLSGEGTNAFGAGFYGAENPEVAKYYRDLVRSKGGQSKMYEVGVNAHPEQFLDWDRSMINQPPEVRDIAKQIMRYSPRASGEQWYSDLASSLGESAVSMRGERPSLGASDVLREGGIPGLRYFDLFSRPAQQGTRNYVIFDDHLVNVKNKFRRGGRLVGKWGGGSLETEGFHVTPGDPSTGAPTRIAPLRPGPRTEDGTGAGGWSVVDSVPEEMLAGVPAAHEEYRPMPWGSDPWVNRLGPTREMIEQRKEEEKSRLHLRNYLDQQAENLDPERPSLDYSKLNVGLRREPGDVEARPVAKFIGELGGEILTDPLAFTPFRALLPLSYSGLSLGSDEAQSGTFSSFVKAVSNASKAPAKKPANVFPDVAKAGTGLSSITTDMLPYINEAMLSPLGTSAVSKKLFSKVKNFPQVGLAHLAIKDGWNLDEIENVTSYLLPKAQTKFWEKYEELGGLANKRQSMGDLVDEAEKLWPQQAQSPIASAIKEATPEATQLKLPSGTSLMKLAQEAAQWSPKQLNDYLNKMSNSDAELLRLAIDQVKDSGSIVKPDVIDDFGDATKKFDEAKKAAPVNPYAAPKTPYTPESTDNSAFFGSNFGPMIESPKASGWKKIAEGTGSNPAGIYLSPEGKSFYIKEAYSPNHTKNELIAASLYDLAGIKTVKMYPVAGKGHIASEMQPHLDIPKGGPAIFGMPESHKKVLQRDFVPHAWLANWDFPGDGGNFGFNKIGNPVVIDLGASMEYRAMGDPKPNFGSKVEELDTMRDPKKNKLAATVFGDTSDDDLLKGAMRVVAIPDEKIRQMVKAHGGLDDLANILIARKQYIAKRYDLDTFEEQSEALKKAFHGDTLRQQPFDPDDPVYHNMPTADYDPDHSKWLDEQMIGEKDFSAGWQPESEFNPNQIAPKNLGFQDWKKHSVYPFDADPNDVRWLNEQTEANRKKGGFETLTWHGLNTASGWGTLNEQMRFSQLPARKFWSSPNMDLASDYSIKQDNIGQRYFKPYVPDPNLPDDINQARAENHYLKRKNAVLVPLWVNTKDYAVFNAGGQNFPQVTSEIYDLVKQIKRETGESPPGVVIHNVMDTPSLMTMVDQHGKKTSTTTLLTFEHGKRTIRSPGAKFDPAKFHLPDWFASTVGLVGGGGATLSIWNPKQAQAEPAPKKWRGGSVLDKALQTAQKYAKGGKLNTADLGDPKNHSPFSQGMLQSDVPGRTDKLPIKLRSGSYVIPADIPSASALGEGNTMAGKKVLDRLLTPHKERGLQMRKLRMPSMDRSLKRGTKVKFADGGAAPEIPIIAAGGEYVVDPEAAISIGNGSLEKGHEQLDKFVKKVRRHNVETLRKLPGPKKN
jgi:hypothetical protein